MLVQRTDALLRGQVHAESYLDVIERIRPVIIELERQKRSIVIVCHIAIIR